MRGLLKIAAISAILPITFFATSANASPADDHSSIVIVYKDGHRQIFAAAEIARISLKSPATIVYKNGHREKVRSEIDRIEFADSDSVMTPGMSHFVGKWEAGDGAGSRFFITLKPDGEARKSIGSTHGTWTLVDGEAHIAWDDGWHDAIRKVGTKHQKFAFEPGRSFDDAPSNVTEARNMEQKPI